MTLGDRAARFVPLILALLVVATSCGGDPPSSLEPEGPGARHATRLWWPMLWISAAVFLVVAGMIVVATLRGRGAGDELDRSEVSWGEPFIAIAGVFAPAAILAAVFLFSLVEMNDLAAGGRDARESITVAARNWWWEVTYANGAVSANEIHIPVDEPVHVELVARDVIHSFWVPELQVKTDMVPGQPNEMWLQADRPGVYRGQCAEYCGLQHTHMVFYVVAEPRTDYEAWIANELEPVAATTEEGRTIFENSSCAGCHTIRGTTAEGILGPDLTHVAARRTIGAGILPNTSENLAAFVIDPQDVKPGVSMPPPELSPDELNAVLDYLEKLE